MSVRITEQRLRLRFGKVGTLRFIGHLDLAKMWERILRRAQLPLEYSRGFNRRPRTQFASPLSLGFTSEAELLDIWLESPVEPDEALLARLRAVSPPDLPIYDVETVEINGDSLPMLVSHSVYLLSPAQGAAFPPTLAQTLSELLAQAEIMRSRKQKQFNFRPLIHALQLVDENHLQAVLSLGEGATGRPQDLIAVLGLDELAVRVHRQAIALKQVTAPAAPPAPQSP